ncbi:MAG: flagellar assembly peptidoglycan hydrolase FlgJ [Burkholderiales bacterium]|nr:flagellar assembly peptidoglycan hydrolase FlgJ [Burkholderiales bacterium]
MQATSSSTDAVLNQSLAIDAQAVGKLRGQLAKDPKAAATQVAKQFEKMFLDMVMKSMRDASPKFDELDSNTVGTFRSMYDEQLSQTLTSGKGLGLADVIAAQIARQNDPSSLSRPLNKPQTYDFSGKAAAAPQAANEAAGGSEQAAAFVASVGNAATSAAQQLGVSPHLVLAHAALESGWGRKPITDSKGRNSHNLFGVKAGSDWTGDTADVVTTEFVGGVAQKRVETFRAYGSYAEAFADYAKLIGKRFSGATQTGSDAQVFAGRLQQGGYATDPEYAAKLTKVADSAALRPYRVG